MKDLQGKMSNSWSGLEFSMKCHINMKIFLMVELMTFRKEEWVFRRKMEDVIACDKVCLVGVISSPVIKVHLPSWITFLDRMRAK